MKVLKSLLWLQFAGSLTYGAICVAMILGWGLWPVSWWWVIGGYSMATFIWPAIVMVRLKIERHIAGISGGDGGGEV